MRQLMVSLVAFSMACSAHDTVTPADMPGKATIDSITITIPETLLIGDTARSRVVLFDSNKTFTSGDLEFTSSDPAVATVDRAGVITGVAEGSVDITVVAQGRMAKGTLRILRPFPDSCVLEASCIDASYDLSIVNGQQLPVKSPWGIGEWDYDSDAGTWMLASGGISFHMDGRFAFEMTHRAASGATITNYSSGLYQIAYGSIQLFGSRGDKRVGQIDGNAFTIDWEGGLTFAFQKRSH